MIVVDSGPLISLLNREEGQLSELAQLVIQDDPLRVIVPWPVYTEVDLYLRGKGHRRAAQAFSEAMVAGELRLEAPTPVEFELAVSLMGRYRDSGIDLPDATVMAMAVSRRLKVFTWDFRHFRTVVVERGVALELVVEEDQLTRR